MIILPSKKVLSVFVLIAGLVAAIIVAFGRDKSSEAINFDSNLVAGDKVLVPENPNWQEELGRVGLPTNGTSENAASTSQETATDVISRSLISNYLALKQNNNLNQETAQKLIDQTVDYVDKMSNQVTGITQLNIVPDNGKQTMIDYGENLGNIIKGKKLTEIKKDLSIMIEVVGSGNTSSVNELDNIIADYEKITGEFIKMPVPKTFVKAHLDITNGVNSLAVALKKIKIAPNDPFGGLVALQLYQKSIITVSQAMQAIIVFIIKNNIVYKQGSGGYYLLYGI